MTAKALLDREPNPSRERIEEAISGNLCRCTGYQQIYESIEEAAKTIQESKAMTARKRFDVIGKPRRRVDVVPK